MDRAPSLIPSTEKQNVTMFLCMDNISQGEGPYRFKTAMINTKLCKCDSHLVNHQDDAWLPQQSKYKAIHSHQELRPKSQPGWNLAIPGCLVSSSYSSHAQPWLNLWHGKCTSGAGHMASWSGQPLLVPLPHQTLRARKRPRLL